MRYEYDPEFGSPVGPWFQWFAWRPVRTTDRGWRWGVHCWRRRFQTKNYLDGPTHHWFLTIVDKPDDAPSAPRTQGRALSYYGYFMFLLGVLIISAGILAIIQEAVS